MRFVRGLALASSFLTLTGCNAVHPTNGGTGENGVLVDGTNGGSFHNDERYTGAAGSNIAVANYSGSGEVIGYTNDHPPTVKAGVAWTSGSDTVDLNFDNKYSVPF